MKIHKQIFVGMAVLLSALSFGQVKTYSELPKPAQLVKSVNPDQVEVVELFSYTCPHCYQLEAPLAAWEKTKSDDIKLVRIQVPGQGIWELLSKMDLTFEAMKIEDKMRPIIFNAIMVERENFTTKEQIADYVAKHDVDKEKFLKTWGSFAVTQNFERNVDIVANQYGINYTPAFIIDGKYLLDGSTSRATSYQGIADALDAFTKELLEQKQSAAKSN